MNKEMLRKAAEQLIETERLCRNFYEESMQNNLESQKDYCTAVKSLKEQVKKIQDNIPELSAKNYWWDTPFSLEPQTEEGFCFDEGMYCECDAVSVKDDEAGTVFFQKSISMDYNSLSLELAGGTYIPLFVNKKVLCNCINEKMRCRYIYDSIFFCREESVVPNLTNGKEGAMDVWQQYHELESDRRAEYQEYLKSHNETWDRIEQISHGSLFTNEERWLMGWMNTDDYLNESIFRDSFALDKQRKMDEELNRMRLQATKASQKVREIQMEQRKITLSMTNTKNILRMIPVAHIVYYGEEIVAIFLHKGKETVMEYECAENMNLEKLRGQCFGSRALANEKPALFPLIWHLAREYNSILPEFSILSARHPNCPEFIWREWVAARWEQKVNARAK